MASTIRFPIERNEVAEQLMSRTEKTGENTFKSNAQLAFFAAMVGVNREKDGYSEQQLDRTGREIPGTAIENTDMEGLAYLLAAYATDGDAEIFREGNDKKIWTIFEHYAAAGLEAIDNWLSENPTDLDAYSTLLNEMKLTASELNTQGIDQNESPEPVEIQV